MMEELVETGKAIELLVLVVKTWLVVDEAEVIAETDELLVLVVKT
jgi:hypothetical protein